MPARSATVILDANIGPYTAKMTRAAAVGATTGKAIDSSMTKATGTTQKLGQATGVLPAKFGALAGVAGGAFAGIGLAAGYAVKTFAQFDVAMDAVGASTGASEAELDKLGQTALDAAADTKFGATEAAKGIEALGKAGVETSDIIGGALKGSLDLAAAGEIEVADAAELAAGAMTQFGLSGKDVPHVADLMAAAAGKAQGSVGDMADALKQSGLVAAQMGISIEETSGTLAAFASNALIGSDAGTSFRTMLLRLANPTGESAALMEQLGIAAYDAQGNFVGMEALAGQLRERLSGLTQEQRNAALATIFGSDAIRAANVLYEEGSDGIRKWTANVDDAGFAAEQAAKRTDNLAGDLERLGGTIEKVAIKGGGALNNFLRDAVQAADQAIQDFDTTLTEEQELWETKYLPALDRFIGGWGQMPTLIQQGEPAFEGSARALEHLSEVTAAAQLESQKNSTAFSGSATAVEHYTGMADAAAVATGLLHEEMAGLRQEAYDTATAFLGLRDAEVGFEQAIDDVTTSIEENGTSLDINTQKGRDNRTALDNVAGAALRVLQQMDDTGASEEDMATKTDELRTELYDQAIQFGYTEADAHAYADEILNIPKAPVTTPNFNDTAAKLKLRDYKNLIGAIPGSVNTSVRATVSTGGLGGFGGAQGGKGFTAGFPLPGGRGAYPVTQGPHDGGAIDYGAPRGTAIFASYPGMLNVSDLGNRSYGKYYTLTGGGRYELGAHLQGFAHGDGYVSAGQLIGWVDSTGNSTGNHLHLLRNFHQGGWTPGGPINTLRGEYVVNPGASAMNRGLLEAINAGRAPAIGAIQLHPSSVKALGQVIAGEIVTAVGAGAYAVGKRADLQARAG